MAKCDEMHFGIILVFYLRKYTTTNWVWSQQYMWESYNIYKTANDGNAIPWRPNKAYRVPEGWGSQISAQSAHQGGKDVSRTQRPPLPITKFPLYSFLLKAYSTPVK